MSDELRPAEGRHPAVLRFAQVAEGVKACQVALTFELIPEDPEAGYHTTYFGSLSDAALEITVKALRACGWTGDDISELPELAESGKLGEIVELVIEHEQYEGKWRAKVKWVNKPGGGKIKLERALEGDDLKRFGMAFRTRIAAAGGAKSRSPAPRTAPRPQQRGRDDEPPPRTDDDIPF